MPTNTPPLVNGQSLLTSGGYELPAEYDIEFYSYYAHVYVKGTKQLLGTALVDGKRIVDYRAGMRLADLTPNVEFVYGEVVVDPEPDPDPEEPPPVVAFRMLAVSDLIDTGGPVYVYKTTDWSLLHTVPSYPGKQATAVRFSPDGTEMAVAYEFDEQPVVSPNIQLLVNVTELSSGPVTPPTPDPEQPPAEPTSSLATNSVHVTAFFNEPRFSAYDASSKSLITPSIQLIDSDWLTGEAPEFIRFNPNDRTVVMARYNNDGARLEFWNVDSRILDRTISLPDRPTCIEYNHDYSLLAVGHWGGNNYTVYKTSDWSVLSNMPAISADMVRGINTISWDNTRPGYDLMLGYSASLADSGVIFITTNAANLDGRAVGDFWKPNGTTRNITAAVFIPGTALTLHIYKYADIVNYVVINTITQATVASSTLDLTSIGGPSADVDHMEATPNGTKVIAQFSGGGGAKLYVFDVGTLTWDAGKVLQGLGGSQYGYTGKFMIAPNGTYVAWPNNLMLDLSNMLVITHPKLDTLIPVGSLLGQVTIIPKALWVV